MLFDLLHRCQDAKAVTEPEDAGAQVALWNLSALLEPFVVEPIDPEQGDLVATAKERLAGSD